jgi:hypothetical protein
MAKTTIQANQKYGRLVVIRKVESKYRQARFLCCCDCGTEKEVYAAYLKNGTTTSCGCYCREQVSKSKTVHGHSGKDITTRTTTYRSWEQMKQRVLNPKATKYPIYGGRGITVCGRWIVRILTAGRCYRPDEDTHGNGAHRKGERNWWKR